MRYLFLAVLFFLGCGNEKIPKVAVLLPLSGKYSSYGKDAEAGIKFFIKKQNPPFEIKIFNFKSDSQILSKTLLEISKNEEFLCVAGPLTSRFSLLASNLAEKNNIPLISPTATNPEITKDKKWIFRMIYSDDEQGRALAKFVREYLGLERAGIFYVKKDPYSSVLTQFFKETFEKEGGKIVGVEEFEEGIDLKIASLRKTKPQILFAPLYLENAVHLIERCIENKFTPVFIGGDGWYSHEIVERFRNYLDKEIKVFISSPFHPDRKIEEIKDFVDEFEIEYGRKPATVSALSYDALLFINECFKNKRIYTRKDLLSCMEKLKEFNGITGKYSFKGHTPKKEIWILKVSQKGFETVLGIETE